MFPPRLAVENAWPDSHLSIDAGDSNESSPLDSIFMLMKPFIFLVVLVVLPSPMRELSVGSAAEMQLTHEPYNHSLDNNDNFSPDDQWLVYDTRTENGGIRMGQSIEKVHTRTREIVRIYSAPDATDTGPGLGAVSYHPTRNQVVFIHGLLSHTEERPYDLWRRFGMVIDEDDPKRSGILDARDVEAPFTAGALRGGTHRHEFSGDGRWIGYTYNDALMADKGQEFNLRTIGVTKLNDSIMIHGATDGANFHGAGISALVVRVTPNPRPGSDEISHAARDSWIGTHGYQKPGGRRQRARAFLGTVYSLNGTEVPELFVVDIPDDLSQPGPHGPLEGTADRMPMPPLGAVQRRLTHTTGDQYPGFSGNVRSSSDGSTLACIAKDEHGVDQVVLASPLSGNPEVLTSFETPVQSDVRWHPNGTHVAFVCGDSVLVANAESGAYHRLTKPSQESPFALVWSRNGKVIAFNRLVPDGPSGQSFEQVFIVDIDDDQLP